MNREIPLVPKDLQECLLWCSGSSLSLGSIQKRTGPPSLPLSSDPSPILSHAGPRPLRHPCALFWRIQNISELDSASPQGEVKMEISESIHILIR